MLAFINAHNLHRTAREVVSGFKRATAEPVPFGGTLTLSTGTELTGARNSFGAVVWTITERPDDVLTVDEWHELCDVTSGRKTVPQTVDFKPEPAPVVGSITVDRKRFLNDIKQATTATKRCPRNQSVLLSIGDTVKLECLNGEFLMSLTVNAEIQTGLVRVAIPAEKLSAIVGKLSAKSIELAVELRSTGDADVSVITEDGRFTLPAEAVDADAWEMSSLVCETFPAEFAHSVTAGELRRAIQSTEYATDTESTRYALGGLCFTPDVDSLTIAATDSRRLAVAIIPAEVVGTLPDDFQTMDYLARKIIVPFSAIAQLKTSLSRMTDSAPVFVAGSVNQVVIESDGLFSIRSLQVEGRFPAYQDVIPRNAQTTITVNRKRFIQSVETAGLVCDEENRGIDISLRFRSDRLEVRGKSQAFGTSQTSCLIEAGSDSIEFLTDTSEPFVITFDGAYLIDSLRSMTSDTAELQLWTSETAAILTSPEQSATVHVVMPLSNER